MGEAQKPAIRLAELADVDYLVEVLSSAFFAESDAGFFMSLDSVMAKLLMKHAIDENSQHTMIVAEIEGTPVGFLMFTTSREFTHELIGQLKFIYVSPGYRNSNVGRMLIDQACVIAKEKKAVVFYAVSMSGIPDSADMTRMLTKNGFELLQPTARRVL